MALGIKAEPSLIERQRSQGTIRLTTAQAVVRFLQNQFSERDGRHQRLIPVLFGIFGHGNVAGLGQALNKYGRELPYYQPCNEQSMVHTAIGFAKSNNRLATLACTASIGPGSTNMLTGAACATINRIPVLLLPSDYYATRHQGPVLQQLEHPISRDVSVNDAFRPLSRYFDRISRPEQLLTALPEAMRVLTDPAETGAVTVCLPQDVQSHAYDFPSSFLDRRIWRVDRRIPDPIRIAQAIEILKRAKRPLIIAGGGVVYSEAGEVVQKFSKTFGIPVGETAAGKSVVQEESDLLLGGVGIIGTAAATQIAREADVVLCLGTRLTDFITGSKSAFQKPDVQFINININSYDANKHGGLPIVADIRLAVEALSRAALEAGLRPNDSYTLEIRKLKQEWLDLIEKETFSPVPGEAMGQGQLIRTLNNCARRGDTVVAAAGSVPGDVLRIWDATGGRKAHLEFGYSCMGYEIPASIGVRMSQPSGEVYALLGDGTYLMNPSELVTAVQEGLKITVVISENHGYQVIRQLQMASTGRDFGNEFRMRRSETNRLDGEYVALDLALTGRGFGARDWHVQTEEEFKKALEEAREETRPCVIVVETEPHRFVPGSGMWWDVAPAEVSDDPVTAPLRAQYERDRKAQQRYYS
jgi:3D-(3,5/4)-trihydroxycyclohexane-1,2-dione acylhydrolase (decyclizing)